MGGPDSELVMIVLPVGRPLRGLSVVGGQAPLFNCASGGR